MSSDSFNNDNGQDKTVFRQPQLRSDGGAVRPVPGGRAAPSANVEQLPAVQPAPTPISPPVVEPQMVASGNFKMGQGLNPLVNCASTLLAVFSKTRDALSHPNVGALHQQVEREMRAFDTQAKALGLKPETVLSARYVLCTIIDEAVLNTPWGADSAWTQRTLLSLFHNETAGGEKFYILLERMRQNPTENIHFIELCYLCLSLGFEGKYRVVDRGRDAIETLRDELFQTISLHRGEYERALSSHWQGLGKLKKSLSNQIPLWVVASVMLAITAMTFTGFRYWLDDTTAQITTDIKATVEVVEQPASTQE